MAVGNQAEVVRKLYEYRSKDTQLALFGAKRHQYCLLLTLPLAEIRTYETMHEVKLPVDFVTFYSTIGGGGAGPYYGLNSALSDLTYIPTLIFAAQCQGIGIDFGNIEYEETKRLIRVHVQMRELVSRLGEEAAIIKLLEIGAYGCGYFIYLVVSGFDYGKVALGIHYAESDIDHRTVSYPTYQELYEDFHSYYQDWLQRIIPDQLRTLTKG